jgi:hypothetical protein
MYLLNFSEPPTIRLAVYFSRRRFIVRGDALFDLRKYYGTAPTVSRLRMYYVLVLLSSPTFRVTFKSLLATQ